MSACFFCSAPASTPCPDCDLVSFCHSECDNVHRGLYREVIAEDREVQACAPFRVECNEEVGRYLVATRNIKPMESILCDRPAVLAPQSLPVCLVCLRRPNPDSFVRCPECHVIACDAECAARHSNCPECEAFSEYGRDGELQDEKRERFWTEPNLMYSSVGVLRMLSVGQSNHLRLREWTLDRLMDHKEDLEKDSIIWPHLEHIVTFLQSDCHVPYSREDIIHAYGVLRINSFGVETAEGGLGRALYPIMSLMSHSCFPNVQYEQQPDGRMILIAQKPIKQGEELTIRYTIFLQGSLSRRHILRDQWYFDCMCPRCSDPTENGSYTSTVKCQGENNGEQCKGMVMAIDHLDPSSSWKCRECQKTYSVTEVQKIESTAEKRIKKMESTDVESCEKTLADIEEKLLTKQHSLTIKLLTVLVTLYGKLQEEGGLKDIPTSELRNVLVRRMELGERLLAFLSCVDPGTTRALGNFLLEYNKSRILLAKLDWNENRMTRPEFLKALAQCAKTEAQAKNILVFKWKGKPYLRVGL